MFYNFSRHAKEKTGQKEKKTLKQKQKQKNLRDTVPVLIETVSSVVDSDLLNTDQDPAFQVNSDPDPGFS
jgi:hypothetical protein